MKKFFIIILISCSHFIFSQSLDMKWMKSFVSPGENLDPQYSVPLPNDGIVITGWQQRPWNPWTSIFVLAVDSSGNELWRDSIERISNGELYISGITTTQGELIVTGAFRGSLRCSGIVITDTLNSNYSTFIARFNNGVLSSFSSIPGLGATQLASDSQGNLLFAMQMYGGTSQAFGLNWSAKSQHDIIVCKVSPANTLLWAKQFSGRAYASLLAVSPTDDVILFGNFADTLRFDSLKFGMQHNGPYGADLFTIFFDSIGSIIHKKISTAGILSPTQAIFNNDKIIVTSPLSAKQQIGVAYQMIDSTSSSVWYKDFPQHPHNYNYSYSMNHITSIDTNSFWAFGMVHAGFMVPLIRKYAFTHFDNNGNVMSSDSFLIPLSSVNYGIGRAQAISSGSSMYFTATFKDSLSLFGKQITGNGVQMHVCRFTTTAIPTMVKQYVEDDMQIYPNPTDGLLIVNVKSSKQKLRVYSPLGALVYTKQLTVGNNEIDLSSQAKGIYCVEVIGDGERIVKKVAIE